MTHSAPVVAQHPAAHPYVTNAIGARQDSLFVDVFDLGALCRAGVRVVHVHFGFEHLAMPELRRWVDDLDRAGIALVHTVHDLDNPHLVDQGEFHAAVGLLVRHSAAVLTLTASTRDAVRRRFGRVAQVVPHPHVVDRAMLERALLGRRQVLAPTPRRGIYVHAATMRPNLDVALLGEIAAVAPALGGLTIHLRDSVEPVQAQRVMALGASDGVSICVEPRLSDDQLWARINRASLVALPYRWGTHSGLLEAARDLQVAVAAPAFGGYVDQGAWPIHRDDVLGSLRRAMDHRPAVSTAARLQQSDRLIAFHGDLYARIAAGRAR